MGQLLPSLVETLRSAVAVFFNLIEDFKSTILCKVGSNQNTRASAQVDLGAFNCRVKPTKKKKDNVFTNVFGVEICGSIHAPSDMHYTTLEIFITDITDGIHKAKPVHSCVKKWQMEDSPVFCYNAELGKLPNAESTLSDWVTVAQVPSEWLRFPRKGRRRLQLSASIRSARSGEELACGVYTFTYENYTPGYIDLEENTERAKVLAVRLAFVVGAADNQLPDCEVELIKNWARSNIDCSDVSDRARRKLDRALEQAVDFFRAGNQIDTYETCREIVEIASLAERYEILELCLYVTQANGIATIEELVLLKDLANWLEVNIERFRSMMEKILPVSMHEVEDAEVVLGVTSDMSQEQTRRHLNKEYRKWNSRVTNSDPEIQNQADDMLKFIADTRSQRVV